MKNNFIIIVFIFINSFCVAQVSKTDTLAYSYAVLRYDGGLIKGITVTYDDKLPIIDLKELLKRDKSPSQQIKGINSVDDEYIFEGFRFLNKQGYDLVTSSVYVLKEYKVMREYIFKKKNR
ncbi:MAG: hypothetical protein H0U95_17210 [Bacteroidetes bacterium]|nr:hypothetical protein [Bacteroidota bacterium]